MQKLSISSIITRSLTTLKDNFAAFFMISFLMKIVTLLLMMTLGVYDLMKIGMMSPADMAQTPGGLFGSYAYESIDSNRPFAFNLGDRPVASAQLEARLPVYTGGRIVACGVSP